VWVVECSVEGGRLGGFVPRSSSDGIDATTCSLFTAWLGLAFPTSGLTRNPAAVFTQEEDRFASTINATIGTGEALPSIRTERGVILAVSSSRCLVLSSAGVGVACSGCI
jgi:hypothetical protein